MNKSKFGRHVGVGMNYHGMMPGIQLGLDLGRLAVTPVSGGGSAPNQGSYMGGFLIDPPVGGFALGDMLLQIPNANAHNTIIAVAALDETLLFAPGHYELHANLVPIASLQLAWQIMGRINGSWLPFGGGSAFPELYARGNAGGVPHQYRALPIYCPHPWAMRLITLDNLADANVCSGWICVTPVHLLDDNPSHV